MTKVNRKLLLSLVVCGLTLSLLPANGQAVSTSRATTPHVTVRSTPRVSPRRTSPRISARTTPRTSPKANINKGPTSPVRTSPITSTGSKNGLQAGSNVRRSIGSMSEYKSLTDSNQRSSYSRWSNYYARNYPGRSANSIYSSYYYWIPYWILLNSQNRNNVAPANIPTDNQGKPRRWIKVGDKVIFVPENIWKKVNKGDKVKLVDDRHIKINGKVYQR
ncbi:hypothetical protein NIAS840_01638 [Ligilactobacillus salivarius NIAS840]|uniref:RcnB family protein n=2 Tax=Ligilactobacillus salivarius TaxID=1624 RepID=F5VFR8_9LACO|nr:hypothetical protein NIAS840_01638 [Ligilactobacillus salivarius NIAS840]